MVDVLIRPGLQDEVDAKEIEQAAQTALDYQSTDLQASLCVVVTDDAEIQALNRQYRGIDAPTDVLSFGMQAENASDTPFIVAPEPTSETEHYLGDVIVSYPRVVAQAAQQGHSTQHELRLLVVHGVLHLLSHEHATPQQEARMWTLQEEILERLRSADDA